MPYINMLPTVIIVFAVSLFLTPLVGKFASKFGFIDLPKAMRTRTDRTLSTRIHKTVKIRLGGLAVLLPFMFVALTQLDHNSKMLGVILGLLVLVIGGVIDDKYELTARKQMLVQVTAAVIAVICGVSIPGIDIAGMHINFSLWSQTLNLGGLQYIFLFPGDFITIFWILAIINAINWMSGIDAIGELTTLVAALTLMLLSVRAGQFEMALLSATLAAGMLGYVPFNWPPSKIESGTAGTTGYGFIMAVFAIISGAKLSSSIMILAIPIIDMIWVMGYRFIKLKNEPFLKRPFVGGNVHLHHRLMALGLTQVQTLMIEASAVSISAVVAVLLGGFSDFLIYLVVGITVLVIAFTVISILARKKKTAIQKKEETPQPPMQDSGPTPEQRYAY